MLQKAADSKGKNLNHIKKYLLPSGIAIVFLAAALFFFLSENGRVYKECHAEAGVEVSIQDFLKKADETAFFTEESDTIDVASPGEYHVVIQTGWFPHKSTLYITDSIAPQGSPVKLNLEMGKKAEAASFVTGIMDATKVEAAFMEEPDFAKVGAQEVKIMLTDAGGNQTEIDAELFISQVVSELFVEAGSGPPKLEDFVIEGENAEFLSKINAYNYTVPADKKVSLKVDGTVYEVMMHIVDTILPVVEVQDIQGFTLLPRKAEDFLISIKDETKTEVCFVKEPNIEAEGEQIVEIRVTDAGGNETVAPAKLTLQKDTEPPVINGAADLYLFIGSSVSYKKNITVTDNCLEGLTLTVDNRAVNLNEEGDYPVIYTAKDFAGNETSVSVHVYVKERTYSEEAVYALADEALARIITPEMQPLEKVQAIFNYNKSHIGYISHSEKESWVRAAYEGLADCKGDCYVYACTAKVLLTRAGIANLDIAKIPTKTSHYWNLVNLGEGWYHFDTTPRHDHPTIFMWTEAQLMEYSANHYGSHNYDHSLYPEVN